MSDVEGEASGPMVELLERHRREKKELREKIQNMKKAAKCGNKQKQKEAAAESEKMEKEQADKHKREIEEMEAASTTKAQSSSDAAEAQTKTENAEATQNGELETHFYKELQVSNKNKKRQEKKNALAKRMEEAAKQDKTTSKTSSRTMEIEQVKEVLKQRGLQMHLVRSDGDCMYNSVAFAISKHGKEMSGAEVRREAAEYMRQHRDDFLPFLEDESESPLDESQFEEYCQKVEKECSIGGVWGGEPELRAIAGALQRKIEVIQPSSQVVVHGESHISHPPLRIVFLRHFCALGEHYNATEPYAEPEHEDSDE